MPRIKKNHVTFLTTMFIFASMLIFSSSSFGSCLFSKHAYFREIGLVKRSVLSSGYGSSVLPARWPLKMIFLFFFRRKFRSSSSRCSIKPTKSSSKTDPLWRIFKFPMQPKGQLVVKKQKISGSLMRRPGWEKVYEVTSGSDSQFGLFLNKVSFH